MSETIKLRSVRIGLGLHTALQIGRLLITRVGVYIFFTWAEEDS